MGGRLRIQLLVSAYMISTCSQSAPWSIVFAHSAPNFAKSAERIEGAIIALGAMVYGA